MEFCVRHNVSRVISTHSAAPKTVRHLNMEIKSDKVQTKKEQWGNTAALWSTISTGSMSPTIYKDLNLLKDTIKNEYSKKLSIK